MTTVVIDYGSGNLRSAAKAFERAASEGGSGERILVSDKAEDVARADRVVLPGVGAFADCRRGLAAVDGMEEALWEAVTGRGRPFFGICVGMQLMADRGLEFETVEGLGWIPGEIAPIEPSDAALKIPHMGWNDLRILKPHPVLEGVDTGAHAYFVHSFGFRGVDPATLLADVDYGGALVAVVGRDNLVGSQFHPEKSQATGLRLIANFLKWKP